MDKGKTLDEVDLQLLVVVMAKYRQVHEQIADLERKIEDIIFQKDLMLTELDLLRGQEGMLMADLTYKYGEGNFDPLTMTWRKKEAANENED